MNIMSNDVHRTENITVWKISTLRGSAPKHPEYLYINRTNEALAWIQSNKIQFVSEALCKYWLFCIISCYKSTTFD